MNAIRRFLDREAVQKFPVNAMRSLDYEPKKLAVFCGASRGVIASLIIE